MVDVISGLSEEETLEAIKACEALSRKDVMLFLTNVGKRRWENDGWGSITSKWLITLCFQGPVI